MAYMSDTVSAPSKWDYSPHSPDAAQRRFLNLHHKAPEGILAVYFVKRKSGELFPVWVAWMGAKPKLNYVLSAVRQIESDIRLAARHEFKG